MPQAFTVFCSNIYYFNGCMRDEMGLGITVGISSYMYSENPRPFHVDAKSAQSTLLT